MHCGRSVCVQLETWLRILLFVCIASVFAPKIFSVYILQSIGRLGNHRFHWQLVHWRVGIQQRSVRTVQLGCLRQKWTSRLRWRSCDADLERRCAGRCCAGNCNQLGAVIFAQVLSPLRPLCAVPSSLGQARLTAAMCILFFLSTLFLFLLFVCL